MTRTQRGTRTQRNALGVLCFLCVLPSFGACNGGAPPPSGLPAITLRPANGAHPAFIEVTGLSSEELSSLSAARPEADRWHALLGVTVSAAIPAGRDHADAVTPHVEGRYAVTQTALTFTPLFPFDPGREYFVLFNPSLLPRPRPIAAVTSVVRLETTAGSPTTEVRAVYPASDAIPENTLRLYIEFSAPMGSRGALDYVRLRDERGQDVEIPFLPVQADFWNQDHTRYTLFFDPGRVKRGILPNQELGRPLEAGRRYTLEVSADWRDAQGQPLKAAFSRTFLVGPPEERPLTQASWRIAPPAARTRDPLIVTFPVPLDHGLLARTLSVETAAGRSLEGDVTLEAADTRWVFSPRAPWEAGQYRLSALSILEDPSGNRLGRAFEIDISKPSGPAAPETFRTSFKVVEPGF